MGQVIELATSSESKGRIHRSVGDRCLQPFLMWLSKLRLVSQVTPRSLNCLVRRTVAPASLMRLSDVRLLARPAVDSSIASDSGLNSVHYEQTLCCRATMQSSIFFTAVPRVVASSAMYSWVSSAFLLLINAQRFKDVGYRRNVRREYK